VRETTLGAYAHQELPFERLVEVLGVERSLAYAPLFQVLLVLQNTATEAPRLGALEVEALEGGGATAKFDLTLSVAEADGVIRGRLEYRSDLFEAATLERLSGHLARLLGAMAEAPERRVSELALLDDAERRQVLHLWNDTRRDYPAGLRVHDLFAAQAARTPEAPALSFRGETVSYAELDARSARLANHLRGLGVGPETRVGVCLERTPELLVALLAVLRAGGAYVPLDPAYPRERLGYMQEDARVSLVLTSTALAGVLPAGTRTLALDAVRAEVESEPAEVQESGVLPENLSHVIFTSGSTGRPKGVMIRHASVVVLLHWLRENVSDEERASVLFSTSINFDVSVAELFGTLCWGGRLVLVENALELAQVPASEEVRLGTMVPSAAAELLRMGGIPASVRALNLAGEPLPADLARALHALGHVERVRNLYGPTEDTTYSTYSLVAPGAEQVLIGTPLANTRTYVLDRHLQPVPVGVAGELYLAGDGLARGYDSLPERTAERFLPDPLGVPGSRMYRTGDGVRWRAHGELEYVGRTDQQVKVRGFRIELGEIEAALRLHPAVRDAIAVVREDTPGERRMVAYVVPAEGSAPEAAELRGHLREHVPEYMVPSAFVGLDAFPLTPNGKIDRRPLPAPEGYAAGDAYEAPRSPTEEIVAGVWAEVLGAGRVGVRDDFFALGGHSLLATRVVSRMRDAFGVELPLRALFEAPTVGGLAGRVEEARRAGRGTAMPRVVPVARGAKLPLSFAQERLWVLDQIEPGSAAYNIPAALRLQGTLDARALGAALTGTVRRHEALRTVFRVVDGEPAQVILPAGPCAPASVDLRGLPAEAREREAERLGGEAAARPFDLARGPLLRAVLVRTGEEEHHLLVTMHHIVTDGWSLGILVREISAHYAALLQGRAPALPELPVQYADHAARQREWLSGEVLERHVGYWRDRLAGAPPVLELPTDYQRPAVQSRRGRHVPSVLPLALAERLHALGRREGATLFMTLLAAFKVLLARQAGQEDVVVGTPVANRPRTEVEGLIGFFLNTLALRTDLSGAPTFRALLARVREVTLGAYAHQELPFERLLEELRPERSLSHSPVFQAFFNLLNFERAPVRLPGVTLAPAAGSPEVQSKFDLTLYVAQEEDGIRLNLVYDAALFGEARMAEMLEQFRFLLEQAADDPERGIHSYSLVTPGARERLPDPARPLGDEWMGSVPELFALRARLEPGRLAVEEAGERWSYGELDARGNQLARHLAAHGVRAGDVVAVYGHRSGSLVWALLGILKAGAAFVVLDPTYPALRLASFLRVAEPRGWLRIEAAGEAPPEVERAAAATSRCSLVLPARSEAERAGLLGEHAADDVRVPVGPDSLAYLSFTSGTTGTPKAVMGRHGSLTHFVPWLRDTFGLDAADRYSMLSGLAHDPLQRDVFTPLQLGAAICVPPPEALSAQGGLARWMAEARVSVAHLTPAMGKLVTDVPAGAGESIPSLRLAFFVGDVLTRGDVDRLQELAPAVRVVNYYGSTETQRAVGYFPVPPRTGAPSAAKEVLPLGRGIRDVQLLVLNPAGGLAGVGEVGEVHVRSPHVALGYLGDAALTTSRFLPNPFGGSRGDPMYRTGDLGRYRPDGVVEPAGRADQQVKVRGFRVEPGEIEAVLAEHPRVREAAVVVREDGPGDKRLAAYVVPEGGAAPDAAGLRAWLRARLPEYMVPPAFVTLSAFPLTPNGKLDRRALPAPDPSSAGGGGAFVAPRTPTEEVVAGIWADVLRLERVGVEESFFDLGGHSLLATRMVSRVRGSLGVELPLRAVFEAPTVAGLAARVDGLLREGAGLEGPPLVPVPRDRPLPLSFAQQRLWFLDRLDPGSPAYNMPFPLRLAGALDVAVLRQAIARVVRRHEALRVVFEDGEEGPVQVVRPAAPVPLPAADLAGLPAALRERELLRLAAAEAARPFDLAAGPLLRSTLVRLTPGDHGILFTLHHVAGDGWSTGILVREVSVLYAALAAGREPVLPELPVQYGDYAAWQRERLRGELLEREVGYWRERLAGAPPLLELPVDRPRRAVADPRGAAARLRLPGEVSRALHGLARREGATLFMTLLAAFQALLSRYSGQDDVVVGTPVAGRTRAEVEGLIGFFVNTLAIRTGVPDGLTWRALLGRVREATLGAYAHQELPFERLVEELQPERSLAYTPVFQAMLVLQNAESAALALGEVRAERLPMRASPTRFDLHLGLAGGEDGIGGELTYRAELFDPATAGRMLERFEVLLRALAEDPDGVVAGVDLLSPAERRQLLHEWTGAAADWEGPDTVHGLFEAQAARTPGAVALVFEGETVTYAELDARADGLAGRLASLGVGPEVRVGVCMERSVELVVALLGALKAGGAYVPLDPGYPAERLAYMAADADFPVLLTQERLRDRFGAFAGRLVCVDGPAAPGAQGAPRAGAPADSLAYVIYTSGSTGRPKGAMNSHRAVVNRLRWMQDRYALGDSDAVLQKTPFSFDVSVWEFFWPLMAGARLVLARPEGHRDPAYLSALVEREGVTTLHFVPSMLQAFLETGEPGRFGSVRRVVCSGEALSVELRDRFFESFPATELHNLYGPTEAAVDVTYWECRPEDAAVPIGRPVANTRMYVLDRELRLAAVGVPGELYIGGAQVGRGYLGRPDLTAERFVPDPFAPHAGARLYRTGDRGRWTAAAAIEYLGRLDEQVKIRGFRVEPGEVEAALVRHAAVREAVVVARAAEPGEWRLVGYVVPANGPVPVPGLRAWLQERLPEHMVPSVLVVLDRIPLTPSGKADRRALPEPEPVRAAQAYLAPRTPAEETVAGIWAEVLRVERVGVNDSFFELGGHSLLAARVAARIRRVLEVEVPLRAIYESPTLGGFAEAVLRAGAQPHAAVPAIVARQDIDQLVSGIDDLSEEELDRLLESLSTTEESEP
jgi:amino acid adenylation domain-containing protein